MKTPARISKTKALELLQQQVASLYAIPDRTRRTVQLTEWFHTSYRMISNLFGESSQTAVVFGGTKFVPRYSSDDTGRAKAVEGGMAQCLALIKSSISEIENFWPDDDSSDENQILNLELIFEQFHLVVRQLRWRHGERPTLDVQDEYDVQDLLHSLLKIYYDDIRTEEWTPSYAGSSSRMDFLLPNAKCVIEVKHARPTLRAKEVGDQLLVDIARYQSHPAVSTLLCFVYDPQSYLANPAGIESDLSRMHGNLRVRCYIRPK